MMRSIGLEYARGRGTWQSALQGLGSLGTLQLVDGVSFSNDDAYRDFTEGVDLRTTSGVVLRWSGADAGLLIDANSRLIEAEDVTTPRGKLAERFRDVAQARADAVSKLQKWPDFTAGRLPAQDAQYHSAMKALLDVIQRYIIDDEAAKRAEAEAGRRAEIAEQEAAFDTARAIEAEKRAAPVGFNRFSTAKPTVYVATSKQSANQLNFMAEAAAKARAAAAAVELAKREAAAAAAREATRQTGTGSNGPPPPEAAMEPEGINWKLVGSLAVGAVVIGGALYWLSKPAPKLAGGLSGTGRRKRRRSRNRRR